MGPKGEGVSAVHGVIRQNRRIASARLALHSVSDAVHPISHDELMRITEIWVDTALPLGDRQLRMMERLVRAQLRRPEPEVLQAESATVRCPDPSDGRYADWFTCLPNPGPRTPGRRAPVARRQPAPAPGTTGFTCPSMGTLW